jgi:hypothetical protein
MFSKVHCGIRRARLVKPWRHERSRAGTCQQIDPKGASLRCANHADVKTDKQCTYCQRFLCDQCVRRIKAGTGWLEACPKCQGRVVVAHVSVPPVGEQLRDLVGRPFGAEGIFTALGIAVAGWLSWLPVIGGLLWLAYIAALVGYYFQIIDHIGREREGMPGPSDAVEDVTSMLGLLFRGVLCLLVGTAPLLIWYYFVRRLDPNATPQGTRATIFGLLLIGQLYLPAAVVAVTLTNSTGGALWPIAWIRIIAAAPVSYALLVLLFVGSVVLFWVGSTAAAATVGRIPIVGGLITMTITNLLLFLQASLVGGFLRRNAEAFGYD